ncbi:MAG: hypothetical protein ACE5I7_12215 [Candidatus Binatia bacterium]
MGRIRKIRCQLGGICFLLLVASTLCTGCTAARRAVRRSVPPVLPSAARLQAALLARRDALQSLRALARVRYRDPQESNTSREALVVARPDRIRVEVLSVFGSVFVLTTGNGVMAAYARRANTVYRGRASPENLERYARLGLPVHSLVDIVLATPPVHPDRPAEVSFDTAAGRIRLRQEFDEGVQLVWFSDARLPVAAEERDPAGRAHWRATFGDYENHRDVLVATRVGFELPAWSQAVEMTLRDIDVNPSLDHSIFALQTPPDSKVVNLDRGSD